MRGSKLAVAVLVLGVLGVLAPTWALAAPGPTLKWGAEANVGQCAPGKQVINVVHKVKNDGDTAVGGGFWALDSYTRRIQVIETGVNAYCVILTYQGSFVTGDHGSPNETGTVEAGIKGSFQGGARLTGTGVLNPSPAYPRTGNLGTFDYACDLEADPGDYSTCSGLFSWRATYFTSQSLGYDWWGWIYRTARNGTWINACDGPDPDCPGNSGDITSAP